MLKNIKNNKFIFLLISVAITFPAILGFLGNGFPQTDDGNWMVIRLSAFYEALRNGQIPVRFLLRLNNDFGYPVSNFLYPLFMYLGVPIHLIGFNFVQTIKVLFVSSIIFSSLFTFLWLRKLFDNLSSLVGAIFFIFFPYHLFDIYKRGSLGEALSFPIFSFIAWQLERGSLFFVSIGIFLLILSHNTLAVLFLPLIFIYGIYRKKIKLLTHALLFGFLISSFFFIPAIYDLQFTNFSKTIVSDFNSYFSDSLTISLLGYGFFFLLFELLFLGLKSRKLKTFYPLISLIFISFFLFSFSIPFWNTIPFKNIIQFPFRLISVFVPISSFLAAYLINKEKGQKKYLQSVVFVVLIFVSCLPFVSPKVLQSFPDSYYSTNMDSTTVKDEYMPKWVEKKPEYTATKLENINGPEKINLNIFNGKKIAFNIFLSEKREIKINALYFPGWQATVNGIRKPIIYNNNGIMMLSLNKGQQNVALEFKEEGVRLFSDILSIIGLLSLFIFVLKNKNKNENY